MFMDKVTLLHTQEVGDGGRTVAKLQQEAQRIAQEISQHRSRIVQVLTEAGDADEVTLIEKVQNQSLGLNHSIYV